MRQVDCFGSFKKSRCRGCRRVIWWGITDGAKNVKLKDKVFSIRAETDTNGRKFYIYGQDAQHQCKTKVVQGGPVTGSTRGTP